MLDGRQNGEGSANGGSSRDSAGGVSASHGSPNGESGGHTPAGGVSILTASGTTGSRPPPPAPPATRPVAEAGSAPTAGLGSGLALTLAFLGMATLGFNRARIGGLAVSDLLFAACALLLVGKLLAGDTADLAPPSARRTSPLILCGSLLLLTFGTLSTFRSWDPLGSIQVVARFAWLTLVWFWILRAVARDRSALYRLLSGWRIAIIFSSVVAILGQLGIYTAGVLEGEDRQMAFMFHPNELASLIVFGLPLFVLDVPRRPGEGASTLRRAGLTALVLAATMTTGSMTAFFTAAVALAGCAIAVPASRGRLRLRRHTGLVAIALGVVAIGGMFVASNSDLPVFQRFTRYQEGDSGIEDSVGTRDRLNDAVINHLDDTLVVGTGLQLQGNAAANQVARFGEGVVAPEAIQGVHNMFLKLIHEAGVPALIALAVVVMTALRQAWRVALSARGSDLHMVAVAIFVAIVAANTMANFGPIAYQRYYWTPVALATCLWSLRRHEARAAGQAADETPHPYPVHARS